MIRAISGAMGGVDLTEGSHASILQELLLALLGYSGDVFVEKKGWRSETARKTVPEPWTNGLNVNTDMHWITAPDRYPFQHLWHPLCQL